MRPLATTELLSAWERGLAVSAVERALLLLAAACAPVTPDDLAQLPIGRRDQRLLELRAWTFGPRLSSQAGCPRCGERLEMSFAVADVLIIGRGEADVTVRFASDGYEIEARLPDSRDLREIERRGEDPAASRRRLLERCVLTARRRGRKLASAKLPEPVVQALAEHLAAADPQAEVLLALACPSCAHRWQAPFDVASFFWAEIDAWARRLLRDVHTLARFYGWSEGEILALSPLRRQCYLEMVGS